MLVPGRAEGPLVGGNLQTLSLLQGTPWLPPLAGSVLLLEDDDTCEAVTFDRLVGSLLQQPGADAIAGLVLGRLQPSGPFGPDVLDAIVARHPALAGVPTVADVDVSHTDPILPVRYGWTYALEADPDAPRLVPADRRA